MGATLDVADPADVAALRRRWGTLFDGARVVCGPGVLAGLAPTVPLLREVGARRPALVATHRGAGPVPSDDEAEVVWVDAPAATTMTEELRAHDRLLHELPDHAVAAVEAFDPDGEAVWLATHFVTNDSPILGRRVYGGRPAAWLALEDKLLAEGLWEAASVPHAPARVVAVDPDELDRASAALDQGRGVVWSGDARDGFNGGGNFVRWVLTAEDRTAAAAFFAPRCDRVRVMPFLEGVPCSIHGMVLPDGTAVFRPVEIAMLRDEPRRRFVYGGLGSFWDPVGEDRAAMRDGARRVGELLRTAYGYRGGFGIDGVLTADGFRPTELNTRISAGLSNLARVVDGGLFTLLQLHLVAGLDPGIDVADLESAVPVMDAHRFGRPTAVGQGLTFGTSESYDVTWDGTELHRSASATGSTVAVVPSPTGLYCRIDPCSLLAAGDRLAPLNAALLRLLDREHGVGFGEVSVAPDVRATPSLLQEGPPVG